MRRRKCWWYAMLWYRARSAAYWPQHGPLGTHQGGSAGGLRPLPMPARPCECCSSALCAFALTLFSCRFLVLLYLWRNATDRSLPVCASCFFFLKTLGADWLVASGHKMCGPTGIGFLWGRMSVLETMRPWQVRAPPSPRLPRPVSAVNYSWRHGRSSPLVKFIPCCPWMALRAKQGGISPCFARTVPRTLYR